MTRRWAGWLLIWIVGTALFPILETDLVPILGASVSPVPGAEAQPPSSPAGWPTYTGPNQTYSVAYPPGWQVQVVFENPPTESYLIRRRLAFHDPNSTPLEAMSVLIDVWDKDPALPLNQWLAIVEGITGPVNNVTGSVEPNAVLAGQQAWVRMEPGGCGVRPLVAAYLPYGGRIYKIHLRAVDGPAILEIYEAMLRSISLSGVEPARSQPTLLPDLQALVPLACGTNLCPSTCWGQCTFAATNEGCCGYHPVPYWQCSKECVEDPGGESQPGDFLGNCVWWGAYTRRDVGALASGNAENWAISVRQTGQLPVDETPKVGDIVVHPGTSLNHVAYVVWVSPDRQTYKMSDMGWCSDCGPTFEETKLRTVDDDDEFIHCQGDPPIPTVDWRFTNCPFGWTPSKGFAGSSLNGITWRLDPAADPAADPTLLSPLLSVPATDYSQLRIQMANQALQTAGKVYFATATDPTFDEGRAVPFTTVNDGLSREVTVDMASHAQWQGTITRLALLPVPVGNADGSDDWIEIDRIRLANQTPVTPVAYVYLPLVVRTEPLPNQPPYPPSEPSPADGATGLPITLTLSWAGGDPDGDVVTYDVYLDPAAGPLETLVCSRTLTTTCDPGPLGENTPYAWRVRATDEHSATTTGPVWAFTTVPTGCVDLIANGGFEDTAGWEIPSTPYPAAYSQAQAHGGSRSMRTGILDPAANKYSYSSIRQLVTIPEGASSATLRAWLYPLSEEAAASYLPPPESFLAGDAQYVLVLNPANQWQERIFWQRRDDRDWIFYEVDLLDYAGQTIKLQFGTLNDGAAGVTAMYVDDVSLQVCTAPLPPAP
jgi:hypothetical protein